MNEFKLEEKISNKELFRPFGYINGEWIKASNNKYFNVSNPSNNKVIATMPEMGVDETKYAVECA